MLKFLKQFSSRQDTFMSRGSTAYICCVKLLIPAVVFALVLSTYVVVLSFSQLVSLSQVCFAQIFQGQTWLLFLRVASIVGESQPQSVNRDKYK